MDDEPKQVPSTSGDDGKAVAPQVSDTQKQAADVTRHQIDNIYKNSPPNQLKQLTPDNPYERTHKDNFDWREYHSAWQSYYQEYYRRYYHHLNSKKDLEKKPEAPQATGDDSERAEVLKQDLLSQVQRHATKIKRSNHFWPAVSAAVVGLVFMFIQFNSVLVAQVEAYVSPGALEGKSLVVIDPTNNTNVGAESRLIIPKINVDMPVNYDVTTLNEEAIQLGLRDAAVHYKLPGANALPGQFGNNVILGHSSNDVFAQGQYKFAFVLADQLATGDTFYLHYQGTRYTYKITEKKVIKPSQLDALQIGADKPMVTIVTCTPAGTSINRLLIFAEQISPDPLAATQPEKPADNPAANNQVIPGNAPTLFEQIWKFFF